MFELIPFQNTTRSLFNFIDNFEKNFFGDLATNVTHFRTDILDKGDKFVLKAELPGFDKGDIKIDIRDNYLTVSAQHSEEKEDKSENYIRRERRYGSFCRSFDMTGIDTEKIEASYNNGILTLDLPKAQPEPLPPSRQIEIK